MFARFFMTKVGVFSKVRVYACQPQQPAPTLPIRLRLTLLSATHRGLPKSRSSCTFAIAYPAATCIPLMMTDIITASYLGRDLVNVDDSDARIYLQSIGFGYNAKELQRRDSRRRGHVRDSADVRRVATSVVDTLNLFESFYLMHGLKRLEILAPQARTEPLTASECWTLFRGYHNSCNTRLDFAHEYAVYHYFKSRGWIIRTGEILGANFLLYRDDPELCHAEYAVVIDVCTIGSVVTTAKSQLDWITLFGLDRVVHSANKKLLIASLQVPQTLDLTNCSCIEETQLLTHVISG